MTNESIVNCGCNLVRRAARRFGFKEVGEEEDWNLYWTDFSVSLERVMDMKRYQVGSRVWHTAFPAMKNVVLDTTMLVKEIKAICEELNILRKNAVLLSILYQLPTCRQ